MILTIDIGNTNITLGVYDGKALRFHSRMESNRARLEDQYAIELRDILDLHGVASSALQGAILCSVVPPLTRTLANAVRKLTSKEPLIVGPGIKTGLNIRIDNPGQLGGDLVAGAVAAIAETPVPCIIFDLGTATTVSVVGPDGAFLGGVILPGVGISLDALTQRTAQLLQISLEAPPHVIGTNTTDSMQAGSVLGTADMMDCICRRIEEELGSPATAVVTGGFSGLIVPHCRRPMIHRDMLILDGLRILFEKNAPAGDIAPSN